MRLVSRLMIAASALVLATPLLALVAERAPSRFDRLVILNPATRLGTIAETAESLPGFDAEKAGWDSFRQETGGTWSVQIDRRSGAPLLVEGSGIPLFAADGPTPSLADVEKKVRDVVSRHEALFKIRNAELVLTREGSGPVDRDHWILSFTRRSGGIAVDDERFMVNVTRGRISSFGADRWGAIASLPPAVYDVATARQSLLTYMAIGATEPVRWLENGTSLLIAMPPDASAEGRYQGAVGAGLAYALTYRFALTVPGEPGTWVGKVDATTGRVVALNDDNRYAQAKGGVYPVSDDQLCPDGCEQPNYPMPYADVTINGTPQTAGDMGLFDCSPAGGTAVTHLAGPYVKVADVCGQVTESIT